MDDFLPVGPEVAEVFTGDLPLTTNFGSPPSVPLNNICAALRRAKPTKTQHFCLIAHAHGEHSAAMHRTRSPLTLGLDAARANALPALIIQAVMLMLLVSFYTSHTAFVLLSQLAELKRTHAILFVIVASVT